MLDKTLLSELIKFSKKDMVRAHMPGHNGGLGLSRRYKRAAFKIDVTEFDETDNLADPRGILERSMKNTAKVFGAKHTFYLVNGSTSGIQAAILSIAVPGASLIVDRACHKSVIAAMIMARLRPVFIEGEFIQSFGAYGAVQPETVAEALSENPDACGAVLTCPTYYGICSDIRQIADRVHSAGLPLIVDEAHGAHFVFSEKLPPTALSGGADVVIQSAHKTLPSPGQSALLHLGSSGRVSPERVGRFLNLIQTSSPSYTLLAGIDCAVRQMNGCGRRRLDLIIERILRLRAKIGTLDSIACASAGNLDRPHDITKLLVDFSKLGISGTGAAAMLKKDYGIYPELADEHNVLFYLSCGSTLRDIALIDRAVTDIAGSDFKEQTVIASEPLPKIKFAASMHHAFWGESETLPAESCEGRICTETLVCCPPCAPITVPGQILEHETIEYIIKHTDIKRINVLTSNGEESIK